MNRATRNACYFVLMHHYQHLLRNGTPKEEIIYDIYVHALILSRENWGPIEYYFDKAAYQLSKELGWRKNPTWTRREIAQYSASTVRTGYVGLRKPMPKAQAEQWAAS